MAWPGEWPGFFDDKLRRVYTLALIEAGVAAEPQLVKALESADVAEPVVAAMCEILRRVGTINARDVLRKIANGASSANKRIADQALQEVQQRYANRAEVSLASARLVREHQWSNFPTELAELRPADEAAKVPPPAPLSLDEALNRLDADEPLDRQAGARTLTLGKVVAARGAQVAEATRRAIDSADTPLSWYALRAHAHWSGEDAIPLLVTHLSGSNPYLAVAAADALTRFATDDSAKALAGLLTSRSQNLLGRLALVRLGRDHPELVANQVVSLLDHEDPRVRLDAIVVVSRLGLPNGMDLLRGVLERHPELEAYREAFTKNHHAAQSSRPTGKGS